MRVLYKRIDGIDKLQCVIEQFKIDQRQQVISERLRGHTLIVREKEAQEIGCQFICQRRAGRV